MVTIPVDLGCFAGALVSQYHSLRTYSASGSPDNTILVFDRRDGSIFSKCGFCLIDSSSPVSQEIKANELQKLLRLSNAPPCHERTIHTWCYGYSGGSLTPLID